MPLTSYLVTVPRIGRVTVNSYSPSLAARQAQNVLLSKRERADIDHSHSYKSCWVRESGAPKRVKSERVWVFNGFGG